MGLEPELVLEFQPILLNILRVLLLDCHVVATGSRGPRIEVLHNLGLLSLSPHIGLPSLEMIHPVMEEVPEFRLPPPISKEMILDARSALIAIAFEFQEQGGILLQISIVNSCDQVVMNV